MIDKVQSWDGPVGCIDPTIADDGEPHQRSLEQVKDVLVVERKKLVYI